MVVAIIALIFIIFLMTMRYSWYSITYEEHPEGATNLEGKRIIEYNLRDFSVTEHSMSNLTNDTLALKGISYDDPVVSSDAREMNDLMDALYNFFLLSILLLIISIAIMPVAAIGKIPHSVPMVTLLIALIFTLIMPIYFFFATPDAVDSHMFNLYGNENDTEFRYEGEFWQERNGDYYINGTDEHIFFTMRYGPEMAFWLAFIPMFIILTAIAVYSGGKNELVNSGKSHGDRPPPSRPPPDYDRDYYDDDYDRRYDRRAQRPPPRPRPPRRRPPQHGAGRDPDHYDERRSRAHAPEDYRQEDTRNHSSEERYDPPVLKKEHDIGTLPEQRPGRRREY
jgi:hypothetical protein